MLQPVDHRNRTVLGQPPIPSIFIVDNLPIMLYLQVPSNPRRCLVDLRIGEDRFDRPLSLRSLGKPSSCLAVDHIHVNRCHVFGDAGQGVYPLLAWFSTHLS